MQYFRQDLIKKISSDFAEEVKLLFDIFNNQIRLVGGAVRNLIIDKNSKKWKEDLITISKIRETGEKADDFVYSLPFNEVTKYFTTLGNPPLLPLVYAILIYVLMLLSWIFTSRSTRFPGLKILFGFGKSTENEL